MSRINTNINSLIGQRVLGQQNQALSKSLERLSTGLAINRGGDNPAGLIASERLRSEKTQISAAIGNAQRADQILNIAEGGLSEIQAQLTELQNLVSQAASPDGLSSDEKEANQQQIDAILASIDRIAGTTSFEGTKLLNGKYDFLVSAVDTNVTGFSVNGAKIGADNLAVQEIVTASAQHAGLFLSTNGALSLDDDADSRFTFELAGSKGTREFSFASGTALADVAAAINTFRDVLGASALVSGTGIVVKSTQFGSDQFVSVKVSTAPSLAGAVYSLNATNEAAADTAASTAYTATNTAVRDEGQDIAAIINGATARGKGLTASVATDALDISITLTSGTGQTLGAVDALTVYGGGATFNLGPTADLANQVRIGVSNVSTRAIGQTTIEGSKYSLADIGSGRFADVINGDPGDAQKLVSAAIDTVSKLRGRLGAVQKFTVGSTINALNVALENTSAAEAAIRDTDFAAETANLTRNQVLVQAATSVLRIANSTSQNVLPLLQ